MAKIAIELQLKLLSRKMEVKSKQLDIASEQLLLTEAKSADRLRRLKTRRRQVIRLKHQEQHSASKLESLRQENLRLQAELDEKNHIIGRLNVNLSNANMQAGHTLLVESDSGKPGPFAKFASAMSEQTRGTAWKVQGGVAGVLG